MLCLKWHKYSIQLKCLLLLLLCFAFIFNVKAGHADTLQVYSNSMHKNIKCVVILPDDYTHKSNRYPVVYLLHGYGGNFANWINIAPQLLQQVDAYKMIIVCPDGGYNSWYLNSDKDTSIKYESFMAIELIKYIDEHYRTIANKTQRAITGLSMGGHGALFLAIKHNDTFGAAGSMSGGVDLKPFFNKWDLDKLIYGDTICCKKNFEKYSVFNLIDSLKPKQLQMIIDCGTEDFFIGVNRNLHQKMLHLKLDHTYMERKGTHNRDYWKNSIDYQLLYFKKYFATQ